MWILWRGLEWAELHEHQKHTCRCQDVAAVDVNMGCPVHFSVSGGMGSALLAKPDTVDDVSLSV